MPNNPPPGTNPPRHGPKKPKFSKKGQFLWAEGQQESGGDYKAQNQSSGALGRWQVMPANLPGWLKQSGQKPMTDQQYLDSPKAQDKLAWVILGGDYDRYGPRGAAAVWYSGQPDWHATYGNPPVYQYVNDVIELMAGAPAVGSPGDNLQQSGSVGTGSISLPTVPRPGAESWANQVSTTSKHFASGRGALIAHRKAVDSLRLTT